MTTHALSHNPSTNPPDCPLHSSLLLTIYTMKKGNHPEERDEYSFLPKLNLPRSILRDNSKPNMYVPMHLDVDRLDKLQKKRRRGKSVLTFLCTSMLMFSIQGGLH